MALYFHRSLSGPEDEASLGERERIPNTVGLGVKPVRRAILCVMRSCVGLIERSESSLGGSELKNMRCCCTLRSAGETRRWGVT